MSTIIYEPEPRYVVETANALSGVTGIRLRGAWNFEHAFHALEDATAHADRLAEDNEHVRVIDRAENEEN
ncbi:hypothetical protein FVO59_11850 [Microbacterium esteraromaticum]|uniref:Uncharacterized protein n=1 Tax=Microbacterium esteraromaticum TaxID=57043 RepID=A0A7D8AHP4_9MICO|nr:hypothetical protein [Microbacterium esteraromaticum]QMU97822.1 hypothetical protein FVO59_11850 [Microbacterium esteraromaticum]